MDQFRAKNFKEMAHKLDLFLKRHPASAEALNLRGVASFYLGLNEEAIHFYSSALQIFPRFVDALNNIGQAYAALDSNAEAENNYHKAILYKPDMAIAYNNLGLLLNNQGRFLESVKKLEIAVNIEPFFAEAHNNLGNAYAALDQTDAAVKSFNKSIQANVHYKDPVLNLLDYYITSNDFEEFEKLLEASEKIFSSEASDWNFYKAKLFELRGDNNEAESLLNSIDETKLSTNVRPLFFQMQAKFFEKHGKYDKAFMHFKKMNESASQTKPYKTINAEEYLVKCKSILTWVKQNEHTSEFSISTKHNSTRPVFIVGFPRSGTTLLDSILRSHSKIDVLEEKPILDNILSYNGKLIQLGELSRFTQVDLDSLRSTYIEQLSASSKDDCSGKILVDKMPLNLTFLPYLAILFPHAKIIVSIRHPIDCVLSCWMQNFKANDAMVNFLSLDSASNLYRQVFDIFLMSEKNFILDMYKLKYENLVNDFETEVRKVLNFLELDWEDSLRQYYDSAASRKRINTPSYDQVIRPLYTDATFRWKKYSNHIKNTEERLSKYIDEFGYRK